VLDGKRIKLRIFNNDIIGLFRGEEEVKRGKMVSLIIRKILGQVKNGKKSNWSFIPTF
jgi:hypothetical protein